MSASAIGDAFLRGFDLPAPSGVRVVSVGVGRCGCQRKPWLRPRSPQSSSHLRAQFRSQNASEERLSTIPFP